MKLRRLLCLIGWHEFTWALPEDGILSLSAPPPDYAKCKHCGISYGVKQK